MRNRCTLSRWVLAALWALVAPCSAQNVRYVDASAPAGGDGLSWWTAHDTLTAAIDASVPGGEIRVAAGTYRPDDATPGGRDSTFSVRKALRILGGYAGRLFSNPDFRDPASLATLLSGDFGAQGQFADNCYHVLTIDPGAQATVTLDGLTICHGNADSPQATDSGGGVLVRSGVLTSTDCTFASNSAGSGGAVSVTGPGTATFVDCTFTLNQAVGSGGSVHGVFTTLNFDRCVFRDGFANTGAGVYVLSSTITLRDVIFERNWSQTQGGGLHVQQSSARVLRCRFDQNLVLSGAGSGTIGGGAMHVDNATALIGLSEFSGNTSFRNAGAILHSSGSTTIHASTFVGNTAASDGGALACNAGTASVVSSVFSGNRTTGRGGAIFCGGPNLVLTNCTAYANVAQSANAGGVHVSSGTVVVTASVLWSNRNLGGFTELAQFTDAVPSRPRFERSVVQGWSGMYVGTLTSGTDPRFADAPGGDRLAGTADDNLRPSSDSPMVDAGKTAALPPDTVDLDDDGDTTEQTPIDAVGEVRRLDAASVLDTGSGPAPVPDIGALEFRCPSDINRDEATDFADFLDFFNAYDAQAVAADTNRDGVVDFGDFLLFFSAYDAGC